MDISSVFINWTKIFRVACTHLGEFSPKKSIHYDSEWFYHDCEWMSSLKQAVLLIFILCFVNNMCVCTCTCTYMYKMYLKPMYRFGKWWKWNISLMGFVYRVVWVLKALWIILSETINILRKLHKTNIFGMPPKILP